ncbi:protein ANTI-SILENCING 1-like isoform X1 [Senna tora]|uniref:Protein ANTI-SILENCING 1-like isoform X1 n=1 Tax=Senna tora TaxID=362788 RepID=A0A834X8T4_9FABA|nr:protein ANTI-SILENCING 1-like isoform X1 [Senna tora]
MSCPTEANVEDETDFKWGNKRGDGVKNKDVQFYESFTYKGVEYFLYDCVYFYQEGDFETSIATPPYATDAPLLTTLKAPSFSLMVLGYISASLQIRQINFAFLSFTSDYFTESATSHCNRSAPICLWCSPVSCGLHSDAFYVSCVGSV